MGTSCVSIPSLLSMIFAILALGSCVTALVFAILNFKALPEDDSDSEDLELTPDNPTEATKKSTGIQRIGQPNTKINGELRVDNGSVYEYTYSVKGIFEHYLFGKK